MIQASPVSLEAQGLKGLQVYQACQDYLEDQVPKVIKLHQDFKVLRFKHF